MEDNQNQNQKTQQEIDKILQDQEEPKSNNSRLPDLPIKTMAEDLQDSPQAMPKEKNIKEEQPKAPAPQKSTPPVNLPTQQDIPSGQIKKQEPQPRPKPKESKKEQTKLTQNEAKTFLSEGISLFQRKFYSEAAQQLQKAINSPGASFFVKRKAKSLIKKAQKELTKKSKKTEQPKESAVKQKEETTVSPRPPSPIKAPQPKRSVAWSKIIVLGIILLLIAAGIYLTIKYLGNDQETETEPESETPQIQSAPDPQELISGQFREIIDYQNSTQLRGALEVSLNRELRGGFFKNLFFKKIENFQEKFLTLPELLTATNSQIPAQIQDQLSPEYNLLVYQQEEKDQDSPFLQDFSGSKRLVLAIKIEQKDGLAELLRNWEGSMVADLSLLYSGKEVGEQKTEQFQENFYRGALIRYLNFPEPNLSIDYLILDDLLIFATSRESTFATANKVMEAI